MVQETIHESPLQCEPNTFSVRAIIIAGAGLAVIAATGMALMAWMFASLAADVAPPVPLSESMLAAQPAPVEPPLEPNLGLRLQEMRQAETALLQSYAWVDPTTGIARVPIERAIELLVAQQAEAQVKQPAGDAALAPPAPADRPVEVSPAAGPSAPSSTKTTTDAAPVEPVPAATSPGASAPAGKEPASDPPGAAAPDAGSGETTNLESRSASSGEGGAEAADQPIGGTRS